MMVRGRLVELTAGGAVVDVHRVDLRPYRAGSRLVGLGVRDGDRVLRGEACPL
jgi:hypothetical protein